MLHEVTTRLERVSSSFTRAARAGSRPVTTSGRRPNALASAPISSSVPGPKMIRLLVANSKRMGAERAGDEGKGRGEGDRERKMKGSRDEIQTAARAFQTIS